MSTNTLIGRLGILLTGTLLCALTAFAQQPLPAPASLAPTATAATVRVTSDAAPVDTAALTTLQGDQATTASPVGSTLVAMPDLAVAEMTTEDLEATTGGHGIFVKRTMCYVDAVVTVAMLRAQGQWRSHYEFHRTRWGTWYFDVHAMR